MPWPRTNTFPARGLVDGEEEEEEEEEEKKKKKKRDGNVQVRQRVLEATVPNCACLQACTYMAELWDLFAEQEDIDDEVASKMEEDIPLSRKP